MTGFDLAVENASLTGDVVPVLTHATCRRVDCRGLTRDMEEALSKFADQLAP